MKPYTFGVNISKMQLHTVARSIFKDIFCENAEDKQGVLGHFEVGLITCNNNNK